MTQPNVIGGTGYNLRGTTYPPNSTTYKATNHSETILLEPIKVATPAEDTLTAWEAISLLSRYCASQEDCEGCQFEDAGSTMMNCIERLGLNPKKTVEILKEYKEESGKTPAERAIEYAESLIDKWDRNGDITDEDISHIIEILKERE